MNNRPILKVILGYFVKGLLLAVPITIILYIAISMLTFLDTLIPTNIPGLGIIILIVSLTLLGFLGSTIFAEPIIRYLNRLLEKIPLVKTIYSAIKDLLSAFVGDKKSFSRPVLVKMNRESDIEKLGFITNDDLHTLNIRSGKIAVYLPHSYNFSGNLYIVPIENVTPINHNTGDVMKFIVSGGVTSFDELVDEKESK